MVCTITGILRDPTGAPVAEAAVLITAQAITATDDGAMLPRHVEVRSGPDGALAVTLLPGRYQLRWRLATVDYVSPLSVPDEPEADLADLLVAAPIPVRGPSGAPASVAVRMTAAEAQVWSAGHPDVLVFVPNGPGEPGALYIGGALIWQFEAGSGAPSAPWGDGGYWDDSVPWNDGV